MGTFKDSQEVDQVIGGFFREAVKVPKGDAALIGEYMGLLTKDHALAEKFFYIMTDEDKKETRRYLEILKSGDPETIKQAEAGILKSGKFIEETLQGAQMILRFNLKDPDLSVVIDATEDPIGVYINDPARKPSADFTLKADVANKFWNGKVNLALALTKKDIVARGPIPKILKLVKILGTMYGFYKLYITKIGRTDLVIE